MSQAAHSKNEVVWNPQAEQTAQVYPRFTFLAIQGQLRREIALASDAFNHSRQLLCTYIFEVILFVHGSVRVGRGQGQD